MVVYCCNDECKYYKDDVCCREAIDINEDGVCDDFERFRNAPEYKQKYWIAKSNTKTHKRFRELRYGRKITINDVDFYTDSNASLPDTEIYLTHARTGYLVGTVDVIRTHFEEFIAAQEGICNVEDLPEGEDK